MLVNAGYLLFVYINFYYPCVNLAVNASTSVQLSKSDQLAKYITIIIAELQRMKCTSRTSILKKIW